MKEMETRTTLRMILYSLSGMALGVVVFLITENFIFLIVFSTIGLTLGITSQESEPGPSSDETQE